MDKKTIEKVDLKGKRVFIRADFNVPLDENGNITDDTRIRSTLPTINFALDAGAKVILASHLGRPEGKPDPRLSLAPVAKRLQRFLKKDVQFLPRLHRPRGRGRGGRYAAGDVVLLENLRFHAAEQRTNDPEFAKSLARLTDVYVNDAFGTAHRGARLGHRRHRVRQGLRPRVPDEKGDRVSWRTRWPTRPAPSSPCWAAPRCRASSA